MNIEAQCREVPQRWLLELSDDEMADLAYAVSLVHPGPTRFRVVKGLSGAVFGVSREWAGYQDRTEREWDRLVALGTERADA